nr:hypothetical protein [Tanacetum cinerariifolium]
MTISFGVNSFACLASFLWHTGKNVSRDPFPKSTEFSANDYDVLIAHPAPFWKFLEPFLCLIGMSRNYTLDEDTYPTSLCDDRTEMDLFAFIQVADPTKVKVGERERAKEEARLLDSTIGCVVPLLPCGPGDFTTGGGQKAETKIAMWVRVVADENVVAERPKRPCKKRQAVTDASGSSHPPKKLRVDHEASSEATTGGKSPSALWEFLASSILNVEVGVAAIATLLMVTSSVSATPEHESGASADSITRLNIRTIGASERFIISLDSFHHSSTNAYGVKGDSIIRFATVPSVMTEAVVTSHVVNIPSVSKMGIKITPPVHASMFHDSDFTGTVKAKTAGPSYFTKQDLSMGSRELNSETLHQEAEAMEVARLHAQVFAADATEKMCAAKIDALKHRNVALENEKDSLDGKVDDLMDQVHVLETTCFGLRNQVLGFEQLKKHIEEFQDAQMNIVNVKVAKLDTDLLEMALHLEEKFYPHILTTISGRRWLLNHGLKLAVDGLSAGIDHGKVGRSLADVVAYNPNAKADYNSAFWWLRKMDLSLLSELKSHKDASVEDIMDLLRLEGPLANVPGMSDLQSHVDQLMLLVHRPEDQVVLGEMSLSFDLSVTHSRVERIRENLAAKPSALIATTVTTTALLTTFAFVSSVPPITIEDYKIVGTDGQEVAQGNGQGNLASFPTVDFEKEELDTNRKRDPPTPLPNASVISYSPSYLGHRFPSSSIRLVSLLWYTRIAAYSLLSSKRSRLIFKALLFCTISTSAVLSVGMLISARMTTSMPYVSEKGVSPLLDLIILRTYFAWSGPSHGLRNYFLYRIPLIMTNHCDLCRTALALFTSAGRVYFVRYEKLVDVIFLSATAFLFSLLGTCLIKNILKLLMISAPSGFASISTAPEPSAQDDSSVNKIHGSESSSSTSMAVSEPSSSRRSTMKSTRIHLLTDTLGL